MPKGIIIKVLLYLFQHTIVCLAQHKPFRHKYCEMSVCSSEKWLFTVPLDQLGWYDSGIKCSPPICVNVCTTLQTYINFYQRTELCYPPTSIYPESTHSVSKKLNNNAHEKNIAHCLYVVLISSFCYDLWPAKFCYHLRLLQSTQSERDNEWRKTLFSIEC
jgi:hypothetical protein